MGSNAPTQYRYAIPSGVISLRGNFPAGSNAKGAMDFNRRPMEFNAFGAIGFASNISTQFQ